MPRSASSPSPPSPTWPRACKRNSATPKCSRSASPPPRLSSVCSPDCCPNSHHNQLMQPLLDAALAARANAHAPYSRFQVGAPWKMSRAASSPAAMSKAPATGLPSAPNATPSSRHRRRRTPLPPCPRRRRYRHTHAALWGLPSGAPRVSRADGEVILCNLQGSRESLRMRDLLPRASTTSLLP